jgi:hypothetical protein
VSSPRDLDANPKAQKLPCTHIPKAEKSPRPDKAAGLETITVGACLSKLNPVGQRTPLSGEDGSHDPSGLLLGRLFGS